MDNRLTKHPFGFYTVANKPMPGELREYYAKKYYQEANGSYEISYTNEEISYFRAKIAQRFNMVKRLHPKGTTLLDVGCGEGFSLAYFREQGWAVRGLDFSAAGVESQNPKCIDALVVGDLFELLDEEIAKHNKYDVIWLQNVLEHVLDPVELLGSLRSLLLPDGVAVVTVPNDYSVTQKEALSLGHIETEPWVVLPDHLSYFDHITLPETAKECGWSCVELFGDFPIDWYLFHEKSNYFQDKSVGKAAHMARVQIENMIHRQPKDDVLVFWSAVGRLGVGRNITAFLQAS